ncbi:putative ABC transport system permease protein [Spirosomataceae bacterium TFI 002]|nr:putative ABC transport system permease protein [Spirosomataceae bacterium TFI 002]
MIKNYFKIAWRNIWNNKVFSMINIVGLAIGMAASIVILLFVFFEKSFDSFHSKNIYRLDEVQSFPGMVAPQKVALSMFPMGPTLKEEFPEIKDFCRIRQNTNVPLTLGNKKVELEQVLWVDENFFQLFDFKLIEGDETSSLKEPNTAVLSKESAQKIFGTENPIGKSVVRYEDDTLTFKVTGIMENVPSSSHLQFDAVFSFSSITNPESMDSWGRNWLVTYLELAHDTQIAELESKFPEYLKRHMNGDSWEWYELFLQPLSKVHSNSSDITHDYINFQKFDQTYTYIFSIIAIIILIIACVNFMNLSTAKSMSRAQEVGLRKSIGAHRSQLIIQFIGESILLAIMAMLFAVLIVWLVLPYMSNLSGRNLEFPLLSNIKLLFSLLGGTLLIGLLSGIYPAFYLSSFNPIKVLKGTFSVGKSNFRNALVVAQFTCAVFLIIATFFAVKQLNYMQDKDPGFDKNQVIVIPLNYKSRPLYTTIKQEFLSNALVEAVTASGQTLGNNFHQTGVEFQGDGPLKSLASSRVIVDPDYLRLYKINILAGRNFQEGPADNAKTYIVNESLAKELLKDQRVKTYESLIGKGFRFGGMDSLGTIVGVSQDFNFNSLHNKIETLCIFNQSNWGYGEISVRIKGRDAQQAIASLQSVWTDLMPNQEFRYSFLDEHFDELYRADGQVSEIVGVLAGLAIFVSCLGLFGLASFAAKRRVKEIGVRKVLGSSVGSIVALLSKDFIKLVLVSILIASPIAWYAVNFWLQDFAYRINIEWWVFLIAAILAISIALLTVSFQAIKAAVMDPVKSLKSE